MNVVLRFLCFVLLLPMAIPINAAHGPNGYHITSNHKNWASFYSTTMVGATTANSDGSGVMLLCEIGINNCLIRLDLLGSCTHNGALLINLSVDGKYVRRSNFNCMGAPVNMPSGFQMAILLSNFDTALHSAMQGGRYIELTTVDQNNKNITMRASLMGYTAAVNAMINLSQHVDNARANSLPLGQFSD